MKPYLAEVLFMRLTSNMRASFVLAVAAIALAGCGGGEKKAAAAPAFRGIYTTSSDCANSGKLDAQQCMDAMEKAVLEHEKAAPSYTTLKSCENTEGKDRCERTHAGSYRPVLLAFLVTASTPPKATPLYAPGDKKVGFRTAAKEFFLTSDDSVAMSQHAQTLAEANVDKKSAVKPKGI